MQGHGRIIAPDFCVAHREANSGLSTLNRTKSIPSIYHQQRQLQKQRGMCLNDTYPFCRQPLSGNCHSICFSKPVLWTATTYQILFSFIHCFPLSIHKSSIRALCQTVYANTRLQLQLSSTLSLPSPALPPGYAHPSAAAGLPQPERPSSHPGPSCSWGTE